MAGFEVPTTTMIGPAAGSQIRKAMKAIYTSEEYLLFHETYKEWAMELGKSFGREATPETFPREPSTSPQPERSMTPEADNPELERARSATPVLRRPQFNAFTATSSELVSTHVDPDDAQTVPHLSQGTDLARGIDYPIPSMPPSNAPQSDRSIANRETVPSAEWTYSTMGVRNTTIFEENITWSFVLAMVLLFLILWAIISKQS